MLSVHASSAAMLKHRFAVSKRATVTIQNLCGIFFFFHRLAAASVWQAAR